MDKFLHGYFKMDVNGIKTKGSDTTLPKIGWVKGTPPIGPQH